MNLKLILFAIFLFFATIAQTQTYSASNFTLVGLSDPETTFNSGSHKYSGCWGWYQASKNKEYAIACSHKGTYWIDITSPSTPSVSAYRAGRLSGCTWRETKSYQNYLYVASDDFGSNSFQIFDMQYLPDSVHKVYDDQTLFERGHTLFIDQDKLYVASATLGGNFSSMQVYSLANPESPTLIRKLEQDYPLINHVHDMFVRNDTIYASCGNQGLYIYQLTSSNTFSLLGSLTNYPFSGYNHSSALTPDGQTLVFMDEVPSGLPVKVADVSNFSNVQVLSTINQFPNTTPHNPFMANNQYCFVSSYQDGLQLFDISNPAAPFLAGYFDTHPQSGGNNNTWPSGGSYNGQWGAYPYFPSGNIFALDRLNGAFILSTHLVQAPLVSASFSISDTICVGKQINLTSTSSGANSFIWNFPSGAIGTSTLASASVTFTIPGTHTLNLIAANSTYSSSVTQTIHVSNITTAISLGNSSCNGCTNGIIVVNPSGGVSPYQYSWHPQANNTATLTNIGAGCYTVDIVDAIGCSTKTVACIVSTSGNVGLPELPLDAEIFIYPNPAKDMVQVFYKSGKAGLLEVKNILGEIILQQPISEAGKDLLDLKQFANGTYFISISQNNKSVTKKIIIQH